jgi:hypothetical protein
MVAMLLIIAFQNTITLPHLMRETAGSSHPRILPSINLVDGGSRGAEIRTIVANAQQPYLMFVDIPSDSRFSGYLCSLYAPSGEKVWQITISPSLASNTVPIQVPGENARAGVNTLLIQGIPVDGQGSAPVDLVKYRFLLQIR